VTSERHVGHCLGEFFHEVIHYTAKGLRAIDQFHALRVIPTVHRAALPIFFDSRFVLLN